MKKKIIVMTVLFILLICIFTGVSYAIFTYFGIGKTNNVIQTGRVVFSYSDANGGGNGIQIEDAVPISDDLGKLLTGEREYFDFSVSASTTHSNLAYEIAVLKDDKSTLKDEYVKIYLTTFEGNKEVETEPTVTNGKVVTYSDLKDTNNSLLSGKTVYHGTVSAGEVSYGRKFRLRMWIKVPESEEIYDEILDQFFTLRVNVAASSIY